MLFDLKCDKIALIPRKYPRVLAFPIIEVGLALFVLDGAKNLYLRIRFAFALR